MDGITIHHSVDMSLSSFQETVKDMDFPGGSDGEGQGGLMCCSPWTCKESDMTKHLNNSNKNVYSAFHDGRMLWRMKLGRGFVAESGWGCER